MRLQVLLPITSSRYTEDSEDTVIFQLSKATNYCGKKLTPLRLELKG